MRFSSAAYQDDINNICLFDLPWDQLKGKRILFSGATGLIGTCFVDVIMCRNLQYNSETEIYAFGRNEATAQKRFADYWNDPNFHFICHDINLPLPLDTSFDYIIHGASNASPRAYTEDPVGTITSNVFGTYHLLEYMVNHCPDARFELLSSVEIYGENRGDTEAFSENYSGYLDCNTLRAGYCEAKRVSESLCQAYIEKYHLSAVISRLCRCYGPTMQNSDNKALAQFIQSAVKHKDIVLKSNGTQVFSYCYMADAVSGILSVLLKGECGQAYNISGAAPYLPLKELAVTVAECAGTNILFGLPEKNEAKGYSKATKAILDISKIKRLGWHPQTELRDGIKKTIAILTNESDKG